MSPTTSTTIEDLPLEMIRELFEYLPLKDLAACSMVNKRWHSIYATFKLHRLAVTGYDPYRYLVKWRGTNQPILEEEQCLWSMFNHLVEKPLLSNLKHLVLFGYEIRFDLNKLNRFRQLVHLEVYISSSSRKMHLNLPKLRVLKFNEPEFTCAVSLDCPELSALCYHTVDDPNLHVKHPETIRKLETEMVDLDLAPFKNVECLVPWELEVISKATLLLLPKLKELRYDMSIEGLVEHRLSYVSTVDELKQTFGEFMEEVKKLRGRDFRFTFAGFELTNVDVEQIDFGVKVNESGRERVSNEYVYMKNYHLIEPGALHFVKRVNYSLLLSHVTGEFPRCFSQKFTGIEEVQVTDRIEDADHFLWFLKSQRFLRSLDLSDAKLSQELYDQLPAVVPSLRSLFFRNGHSENEMQLNFDFVTQFSHLSDLEIYPISLSSATSLVRWLGGLEEVSIQVQSGGDLWIKKESYLPVWKVQEKQFTLASLFRTENPGEIANFLEEHRPASSKIGKASD